MHHRGLKGFRKAAPEPSRWAGPPLGKWGCTATTPPKWAWEQKLGNEDAEAFSVCEDAAYGRSVSLASRLKQNPTLANVRRVEALGNGVTPLLCAVAGQQADCIRLLLDAGADPFMRAAFFHPDDEVDAFELAMALFGVALGCRNEELILLLEVHRRKVDLVTEPDCFFHSAATQTLVPMPFHPEMRVKSVKCGHMCVALLTDSGSVYTFGNNSNAKLGLFKKVESTGPRRVMGALRHRIVTDLGVGKDHMVVCDDLGTVFGWGNNRQLQLGVSTSDYNAEEPVEVASLRGHRIVAVDAGELHSLFLSSDGIVLACGSALQGRLGCYALGTPQCTLSHAPVVVPVGVEVTLPTPTRHPLVLPAQDAVGKAPTVVVAAISCGRNHSAALDTFGRVWTWGFDQDFRCGLPTGSKASKAAAELKLVSEPDLKACYFPYHVASCPRALSVACGPKTTYALTASAGVVHWGQGSIDVKTVERALSADVRAFACAKTVPLYAAINSAGQLVVQSHTVAGTVRLSAVAVSEFACIATAGRDRSVLGEALKGALLSSLFCDVRFLCADGVVPAHRGVVCSRLDATSALRAMLLNPPADAQRDENGVLEVPVEDSSSDLLMTFLLWIYSDRTSLSATISAPLIALAKRLGSQQLVDLIDGRAPEPTFSSDILKMLADPQLAPTADFLLGAHGSPVLMPCHRVVLASRAPFFQAMLAGGYAEASAGRLLLSLSGPLASSQDTSASSGVVIHYLLEFLYTNHVASLEDPNHALLVLQLANELQLSRLIYLCESVVDANLEEASVAFVWACARLCNAVTLERRSVEYARHHWKEVVASGALATLDRSDVAALTALAGPSDAFAEKKAW